MKFLRLLLLAALLTPARDSRADVCAYVVNNELNEVVVIAVAGRRVTATVPVGMAPRAIALSPDGARAYVANAGSRTISVIDTSTNEEIASAPSGRDPRDVVVSPDGRLLFVTNGSSDAVSVLSTATLTEAQPAIDVGDGPRSLVASPDGERLYVVATIDNAVGVVDVASGTVAESIAVAAGPSDLALSADGRFLYVVTENNLTVVSTDTNQVGPERRIGDSPRNVAVAPNGERVYMTDGDALYVIDAREHVLDSATGIVGPRALAVTPDSREVYVATESGSVVVFDAAAHRTEPAIEVGSGAVNLVIADTPGSCGAAAEACGGDCNRDGAVTVDEILTALNIALGNDTLAACSTADANGDQQVQVDEIVAALAAALGGCPIPS